MSGHVTVKVDDNDRKDLGRDSQTMIDCRIWIECLGGLRGPAGKYSIGYPGCQGDLAGRRRGALREDPEG